jgi:ankyrin repeat protein
MRTSRLRHRVQATFAIVGTVAAVFGASRLIKAKAHTPPPAQATYTPPVYSPPIIPRTTPEVDPTPAPVWNTAELNAAAAEGDTKKMAAAWKDGMPTESAMLAAAEANKPNAIEWLLDKGANADDAGVILAADKSPAVLKVLFAKGAKDVSLLAAVDASAVNAVNRILAKGGAAANPNSDEEGPTPMTSASMNGNPAIIRALIAHGGKVDENHLSNAMTPDENGNFPALDAMLTANISPITAAKSLDGAIGDSGEKAVKKLAAKGIAWSWRDAEGDQHHPLLDAIDRGDTPVVRAMIESGAPVNTATEFGRTPLGAALATNAGTDDGVRLVRLLLARGADPNRRLDTGERPLAKAAASGDIRLVTMLIDHGAAVNAGFGANDDETALEAAENAGQTDVARVLRARGARHRPVRD